MTMDTAHRPRRKASSRRLLNAKPYPEITSQVPGSEAARIRSATRPATALTTAMPGDDTPHR